MGITAHGATAANIEVGGYDFCQVTVCPKPDSSSKLCSGYFQLGSSTKSPARPLAGHHLRRPYFLSSDHVCSPQSHLNIRTVPPVWGFSIDRSSVGFLSQLLQALIELGA